MQPGVARVSIDQFRPGHVFAQRFTVQRLLGVGGMGAVYEVQDLKFQGMGRALKILKPEIALDPDIQTRFVAEAQVAKALSMDTDHVVRVDEYDQDPATGCLYLVMELLQGETIGASVARSGPMSWEWVTYFSAQIFEAIGAAHRREVVHRDIKPDNLFVAQIKGRPAIKVLDFGIAKRVEAGHRRTTRALGTPDWAAPEQASNRPVTPATDVWALGLVVYFLATGRVYWESATDTQDAELGEVLLGAQEPASQRSRRFAPAVTLPAGFDAWFARCVHAKPDQRFTNATEAFQALAALVAPAAASVGGQVSPFGATVGLVSPLGASVVGGPASPHGATVAAWNSGPMPPTAPTGPISRGPLTDDPTMGSPGATVVPSLQAGAGAGGTFIPTPTSTGAPRQGTQIGPMPSDPGTGPMSGSPGDPSFSSIPRPPSGPLKRSGGGLGLAAVLAGAGAAALVLTGVLFMRHRLTNQRTECTGGGTREVCEAACEQVGQWPRWMTGDAEACARLGELQDDTSKATADRLATSGPDAIVAHDAAPLDKACKGGIWRACTRLGQWYAEGRAGQKAAIEASGEKAQKALQDGCKQGEPLACRDLGLLGRQGNGVRRDDSASGALFSSGCKADASLSCASIADLHRTGQAGLSLDLARAAGLDHKGCEGGDPMACRDEAQAYETTGDKDKARAPYESARTQLRKGCDQGNARWCLALGDLLDRGLGGDVDATTALEMRRRACASGLPEGCTQLGNDKVNAGIHAPVFLEVACRAGDADGCLAAGQEGKAIALWDRRCEMDGAESCARLARQLEVSKGAARDPAKSVASLKKACRLGHGASCFQLGAEDKGGGADEKPVDWFVRGCQVGDGRSCQRAGALQTDSTRAAGFQRQGCELFHGASCSALAEMHRQGLGVVKSQEEAEKFYGLACKLGDGAGCYSVGLGLLVAKDLTRANEMFALSCDRQDAGGCREYGQSLCLGRGVPRDATKGQGLLKKACDSHDKAACTALPMCRPDAPVVGLGAEPASPGPRVPPAGATAKPAGRAAQCRARCCPAGTSELICQSCMDNCM